jgi:hypothetical protein
MKTCLTQWHMSVQSRHWLKIELWYTTRVAAATNELYVCRRTNVNDDSSLLSLQRPKSFLMSSNLLRNENVVIVVFWFVNKTFCSFENCLVSAAVTVSSNNTFGYRKGYLKCRGLLIKRTAIFNSKASYLYHKTHNIHNCYFLYPHKRTKLLMLPETNKNDKKYSSVYKVHLA